MRAVGLTEIAGPPSDIVNHTPHVEKVGQRPFNVSITRHCELKAPKAVARRSFTQLRA